MDVLAASPDEQPARRPSRRQKVDRYPGEPALEPVGAMPEAPEAPHGHPLSYNNGDELGGISRTRSGTQRSFAERVGVVPDRVDSVIANAHASSKLPQVEGRRRSRAASLGEGPKIQYAQVQQPVRASYGTSDQVPASAARQQLSVRTTDNPTSVPILSAKSRNTPITPGGQGDWAADRSPLQRLEAQFTEQSKEEKRARVRKAEEALLRKQAAKRASQPADAAAPQASLRRASAGTAERGAQRSHDTDPPEAPMPPAFTRPDATGMVRSTGQTGSKRQRIVSDGAAVHQPSSARNVEDFEESPVRQAGEEFSRRRSSAVRFHYEDETIPAVAQDRVSRQGSQRTTENSTGKNKVVPSQQQQLYSARASQDAKGDPHPDPLPRAAVHSHTKALEYSVPPQTEGGIRARQQIGFGKESHEPGPHQDPKHRHFSDVFHHHRPHEQQPLPGQGPPRHLDEWRQAGTARLTLVDIEGEEEESEQPKAWWEKPRASIKRRSGSRQVEDDLDTSGYDGAYDDSNGMPPDAFVPLSLRRSFSTPALDSSRGYGAGRARAYVGNEDAPNARRRHKLWRQAPEMSLQAFLEDQQRDLNFPFAYSHACGRLSEHDPVHPAHANHICQPYVSNELTKAMRSIRVRQPPVSASFSPPLYLKCGPLLRYTGSTRSRPDPANGRNGTSTERETWRGSIMIVTLDARSSYQPAPTLRLFHQPMDLLPEPPMHVDDENGEGLPSEYVDPVAGLPKMDREGKTVYVKPAEDLEEGKDVSKIEDDDGLYEVTRTANVPSSYGKADGPRSPNTQNRFGRGSGKRTKFKEVKGHRLHAERGVTFWRFNLEVELGDRQMRVAYQINKGTSIGFWVPQRGQTMNIMFHSCNGFSLSVDPNLFSGPDPLWRDVLNAHQLKPFHVMIGGGDQIYNDAAMKQTRLFREWLELQNPHHKHEAEFTPEMQEELETFYLERYVMWFSQGLFGMANSQIPMVNIWDDHDIIDGFGSYPHSFMKTPVFSGLGTIAYKYYMLFQHQSVPDETEADEPSWLLGASRGPYINEYARGVFMFLGKSVALLGLDCRTERMRDEVLSEESYHLIFDRCHREIVKGETKHLVVLLGVPIAYPRLVWLENILTSRVMDPVKALGRAGLLGNFLNKFDGGVEILDDLDDHWTAKNHKDERNWFIEELQELAAQKSVRVTILGGDVHLAAVGQFYSNAKLKIPKDQDHRYMPNVISSAIVNTPPPDMMADVLNKRNKIHHMNPMTDEDMIPMFTHDVDGKPRNNKHLLPRRNWCSITEYFPGSTPPPSEPSLSSTPSQESIPSPQQSNIRRSFSLNQGGSKPVQLLRRLSGSRKRETYSPEPDDPYTGLDDRTRPRRHSTDGNDAQAQMDSHQPNRVVSGPPIPIRPVSTFQRRPTNLSEKAAAKGGADTSGEINLQYGLDVKLNCEIKQGDPSGSTEAYRLLVPALWYDEARHESGYINKKTGLLRRLSAGRGNAIARNQGAGEWGQGSFSGSQSRSSFGSSGSEGHEKRRFGFVPRPKFFRQRPRQQGESPVSSHETLDTTPTSQLPRQPQHTSPPAAQSTSSPQSPPGRRFNATQPLPSSPLVPASYPQRRHFTPPDSASPRNVPPRGAGQTYTTSATSPSTAQAHPSSTLRASDGINMTSNASHNSQVVNTPRSSLQPPPQQPSSAQVDPPRMTIPRRNTGDYMPTDAVSDEDDESLMEKAKPRRRLSKFDKSGNSDFFGTGNAGGPVPGAQAGGYGGVEAYKEDKGGIKRFFSLRGRRREGLE